MNSMLTTLGSLISHVKEDGSGLVKVLRVNIPIGTKLLENRMAEGAKIALRYDSVANGMIELALLFHLGRCISYAKKVSITC